MSSLFLPLDGTRLSSATPARAVYSSSSHDWSACFCFQLGTLFDGLARDFFSLAAAKGGHRLALHDLGAPATLMVALILASGPAGNLAAINIVHPRTTRD